MSSCFSMNLWCFFNGVVQYFLFSFALRQRHPMLADVLVIDVLAVAAASSVYKVDLYTLHDQPGLHRIHELIETEPKVCGCIEKETAQELGRVFLAQSNWVHTSIRDIFVCVPFERMRHVSTVHADFDASDSEHGPASMWTMSQCSSSAANYSMSHWFVCCCLFQVLNCLGLGG